MSELARIEARIRALGQLSEVVRAMRGMASARLREAEQSVRPVEIFSCIVAEALDQLAEVAADAVIIGRRDRDAPLLLLVTAEHGFVGAFSEGLARHAARELRPGERLHIVGQRGATIAAEHGLRAEAVYAQGSHAEGVITAARQVVRRLSLPAGLRLVYPRPVPGGAEVRIEHVLPRPASRPGPRRQLPLLHLPPPLLYRALLEELVCATVVRAMLDAFAAENSVRLRAMERAERNIRDRVAELTRERHRLRQETITDELLDIVSGAEAVRETVTGSDTAEPR